MHLWAKWFLAVRLCTKKLICGVKTIDMAANLLGNRFKRYKGLVALISSLILFIIIVVVARTYMDTVLVQRETFARALTLNYVDMIERFGTEDPERRLKNYIKTRIEPELGLDTYVGLEGQMLEPNRRVKLLDQLNLLLYKDLIAYLCSI